MKFTKHELLIMGIIEKEPDKQITLEQVIQKSGYPKEEIHKIVQGLKQKGVAESAGRKTYRLTEYAENSSYDIP